MVSVQEAKNRISEKITFPKPSRVDLDHALGLILARDVYAGIDVPPFDNSAMDGYAVLLNSETQRYRLVQYIQAGKHSNQALHRDEAARIFTGAPVPPGADTIVQQELAREEQGFVYFEASQLKQGTHIRRQGSQCRKGDTLARSGQLVTPGLIALLASSGLGQVEVFLPPAAALITTGNELKEPGSILQAGEIYNSNEATVKAYLKKIGIKNIRAFFASDDIQVLKTKLKLALKQSDIIILTGGISVGEHDYVRQVLLEEGVQTLFYKVKQRPGKPFFAGLLNGKWIFGLPGNPASVISCFNQYVKPCILSMMGHSHSFNPTATLPLAHAWHKEISLTTILKAKNVNGLIHILPGQESFNLMPFADANCFVVLDENTRDLKPGELVDVYEW